MVRPSPPGPHPPPHHREAPAGNRTGHGGGVHAVPVPMAARLARVPVARRGGPPRGRPSTGRLRGSRLRLGASSVAVAGPGKRALTAGPTLLLTRSPVGAGELPSPPPAGGRCPA